MKNQKRPDSIFNEILSCTNCDLHAFCRSPVPGTSFTPGSLMIVGEAPGEQEDREGQPFVGQSGKLLTKSLGKIGLARSDVFITNVVKCRPPNNRDPLPEEVSACLPWINRQIEEVKPKLIIALGRIAASHLLDRKVKITKEHGMIDVLPLNEDVLVSIIYHPSYVLRNRNTKIEEDFLDDLKNAKEISYGTNADAEIRI